MYYVLAVKLNRCNELFIYSLLEYWRDFALPETSHLQATVIMMTSFLANRYGFFLCRNLNSCYSWLRLAGHDTKEALATYHAPGRLLTTVSVGIAIYFSTCQVTWLHAGMCLKLVDVVTVFHVDKIICVKLIAECKFKLVYLIIIVRCGKSFPYLAYKG